MTKEDFNTLFKNRIKYWETINIPDIKKMEFPEVKDFKISTDKYHKTRVRLIRNRYEIKR